LFEKNKAAQLCRAIDDYRDYQTTEIVVFSTQDVADFARFWRAMGGPEIEGKPDTSEVPESIKESLGAPPRLFKVRKESESSEYTFESVAVGYKVQQSLLDARFVMLYDLGFEVYVWIGKELHGCFDEKAVAVIARKYFDKYNRPQDLHVHRILEGGENEVFMHFLYLSG